MAPPPCSTPSSSHKATRSQSRLQFMASALSAKSPLAAAESTSKPRPEFRYPLADLTNDSPIAAKFPLPAVESTSKPRPELRCPLAELTNDSPIAAKSPLAAAESTSKVRPELRCPLADLTNDSPIVGLSFPAKTVSRRFSSQGTPGGEEALRSQVKLLLQKVETEIHKTPSLRTLSHINGFLSSPSRLAAPTPANTPATSLQTSIAAPSPRRVSLLTLQEDPSLPIYVDLGCLSPQSVSKCGTATPSFKWSVKSSVSHSLPTCHEANQEVIDIAVSDLEGDEKESPGQPLTRALLFGSPDKSAAHEISFSASIDVSDSSDNTSIRNDSDKDNEVSDWSVLVNVSSPGRLPADSVGDNSGHVGIKLQPDSSNAQEGYKLDFIWDQREYNEDCEDRESYLGNEEEKGKDDCYEDDEGYTHVDECDELCSGLSRMNVEDTKGLPEYKGKHVRFIYNSDDEIEGEEVISAQVSTENEAASENGVKLKGLPTPLGKHLHFPEEED